MKKKYNRNIFLKQIKAKKHILGALTIFILMITVSFSAFIFFVPTVLADEGGTEVYVGTIDAGEWSSDPGMQQTSSFFYYNSSGAWIITLGGFCYTGGDTIVTDDVTRTTIDNTGGGVANTSVVIGDLTMSMYSGGIVFDWTNATFYILGGHTPRQINVLAFSLTNNTCWDTGANLPYASRSFSPQGIWYDETCWVFGGNSAGDEWEGDVICYKPGNNTAWKQHELTTPSGGISNPGVAYDGTSDFCYIFGGMASGGATDNILCYRFANNSDWKVGTLPIVSELTGCIYNDVNETFIIGPYSADDNIVWWNTSIGTPAIINNHSHAQLCEVVWDNRTYNKTAYFFAGGLYNSVAYNDIWKLDEFGVGQGPDTSVSLVLNNNKFTAQGEQGNTSWCNETGASYETGEFNITWYSGIDIEYIRVNLSEDLHANITNSNISIQFNIKNGDWNPNLLTLDDGANTIWLNDSEWTANAYCIGSSPFPIQSTSSIWWRTRVAIPTDIGNETYSKTTWTWDAGYYS